MTFVQFWYPPCEEKKKTSMKANYRLKGQRLEGQLLFKIEKSGEAHSEENTF